MGHKVLIVDDSLLNRVLLREYLLFRSYSVDVAAGGQECLDLVATNTYDCVILDIQMPEVDGIMVLQKIRSSESEVCRSMPIIALTALAYARDRDMCMNAGASLYLAKPVPLADLVLEIEKLIGQGKLGTGGEACTA